MDQQDTVDQPDNQGVKELWDQKETKAFKDSQEAGVNKGLLVPLDKLAIREVPQVRLNGDPTSRLPNTTSIAFEFIEGEGILLLMDQYGICASSGSACTSGSLEPSHVLRAMGVPFTAAHGSIRYSLSIYNTEEEIDFVIDKMPPIIERLRQMSPFWQQAQKAS